jgi:hypothetical protein
MNEYQHYKHIHTPDIHTSILHLHSWHTPIIITLIELICDGEPNVASNKTPEFSKGKYATADFANYLRKLHVQIQGRQI